MLTVFFLEFFSLFAFLSLTSSFLFSLCQKILYFLFLFLNFYVIGMYPSHSPKTIYYVHVTSLLLCPLLPLEMALPLMNICSSRQQQRYAWKSVLISKERDSEWQQHKFGTRKTNNLRIKSKLFGFLMELLRHNLSLVLKKIFPMFNISDFI